MATESQVSVRELKNQTSSILRQVEAGQRVIVTKRGRPVAVIEPSNQTAAPGSDSIYLMLRRHIEARNPGLRRRQVTTVQREFERISRKVARTVRCKDWREMDRVAKGDRFGLSRY